LGLAVSYKIVQEHGGRIDVKTEKDVGTTFTATLPGAEATPPGKITQRI
jgi:two-component system, sporulation sensor kinase E